MALRPPKYRLHKGSGQALVQINGQRIYLGTYGSEQSQESYRRLIAEWANDNANAAAATGTRPTTPPTTINELIVSFWKHAQAYYRRPDGTHTNELCTFKQALRVLQPLFGACSATEFGPRALACVRNEMIKRGWSRVHINKQISRVRSVFKWAAAHELIPATVHQSLQTLAGLRAGRSEAKEMPPVRPVLEQDVAAIRPFVSQQIWALINVQLLTGARAAELTIMQPGSINRGARIWTYAPLQHKTRHHGHSRTIYLGPRAQQLIRPFLAGRSSDAYVFNPIEAENERHRMQRIERKSRVQPSQLARAEKARVRTRRRPPGSRYTTDSYRRAIHRACRRAKVPIWSPHQLRHTAATMLRRQFGIEAARIILGHRSAVVTEVYAELDHAKAAEIMAEVG